MRVRVLVTGGTGVIGREITRRLAANGHSVDACGRAELDVCDASAVTRRLARGYDALVHLAALVHSAGAPPEEYERVNHLASVSVFDRAVAAGVRAIVFASSVEVYGRTPYGKSKLAAEEALRASCHGTNVRYLTMRLAPVVTPDFTQNADRRIYLKKPSLAYLLGRGDYTYHLCAGERVSALACAFLEGTHCSLVCDVADDVPMSARALIAREKAAGRARVVLRVPYALARLGVILLGGRGYLTRDNLKKAVASATWDTSAMRGVLADSHG